MERTPERTLTRFEMPAIFLISAFLIGAALPSDPGLWRTATAILFSASGIAVFCAFLLARRFQPQWS